MFTRSTSTTPMSDPFRASTVAPSSTSNDAAAPASSSSSVASTVMPSFLNSLEEQAVFRSIDVMSSSSSTALPFTSLSRQSMHSSQSWPSESFAHSASTKKLDFASVPSYTVAAPLVASAPAPSSTPRISCPSIPEHIEPYSTFLSYTMPEQIVKALRAALRAQHVDFHHEEGTHKISCTAYRQANSACFNIYVYSGKQPDSFAVEFQRRSGCSTTFNSLYSRMTKSMGSVFIKPYHNNVCSPQFDVTSVPCTMALDSSAIKLEAGCLDILCDMVSSGDKSSAREALIMLANNHIDADLVKQKEASLVNVLTYALSCRNEEFERCAALLLFKLANSRSLSSGHIPSLISNAISLFESATENSGADASLYLYDTKRHLASSLAALSYVFPNELIDHRDALKRFRCDNDSSVNRCIESCLNNLGLTC